VTAHSKATVIPAKAGIQGLSSERFWVPAFAGTTEALRQSSLDCEKLNRCRFVPRELLGNPYGRRTAMDLRLNQLATHLERTLAPIYVVHGDEPLLAIEAGDAIRAAARTSGCAEREVQVVEPGFKWDAFLAASANMGLFGTRKLIDLRITSGKPGSEGGKALEACAARPNPDQMLLVTLPKLDRATQSSAWFSALADAGVAIAVFPLERRDLPPWIAARLARQGQRVTGETLAFLAERCEGNLLAARQEIEKLGLLLPGGELAADAVERAVTDVARYDIFELSAAWLSGDAARTLRILAALQAEGEGIQLLLWQLAEDIHALASVQEATASGTPVATAIRNARVWGKRQAAMEGAARRTKPDDVVPLMRALANLDAVSKGIGRGNAWDDLRTLALALAGSPPVPLLAPFAAR